MIKTDIIGNLGQDATVNNVNGRNVINFSLAHTEKYKDTQGIQHDKTLWIRAAYWTDKTGVVPYLKKGTMVFVTGQPEVGVYQDKQGKWQAEFKLRVGQIQLLSGNKDSQEHGYAQKIGNPNGSYGGQATANDITEPIDDLPF